jgi:hypothetical protein
MLAWLQVVFDLQQEGLHGGFRVEARLLGKRSQEPIEVGWGRARNKQLGKQVGGISNYQAGQGNKQIGKQVGGIRRLASRSGE